MVAVRGVGEDWAAEADEGVAATDGFALVFGVDGGGRGLVCCAAERGVDGVAGVAVALDEGAPEAIACMDGIDAPIGNPSAGFIAPGIIDKPMLPGCGVIGGMPIGGIKPGIIPCM